jgi:hypothetical protein
MLDATYVWDLGLSEANQNILTRDFPTTHKRRFPYEEYPAYFNIHVAAGDYAWKPVAIWRTVQELQHAPLPLLWCDAGNRQMGTFDRLESVIRTQGVYTPISWGTVRKWTHPACLAYFNIGGADPVLDLWPRNGAIVGFDMGNGAAMAFLKQWADLAQVKECIAPEGSNRDNHRQDQAVLTLLYYKYTNNQYWENSDLNMAIHQDCD